MKEKLIAMLKAAGVENAEAVATQMLASGDNGKLLIDDGKDNVFIPKSRFDDESAKKKAIQASLDEANAAIKGLEKDLGENQEALKNIADYRAKAEKAEANLEAISRKQAIKEGIAKFERETHDSEAVMALLDNSRIVVKDGVASGLDEQLKEMLTGKAFLFKEDGGAQGGKGTGNLGNPSNSGGSGGKGESSNEQGIGAKLGKAVKDTMVAPETSFFS